MYEKKFSVTPWKINHVEDLVKKFYHCDMKSCIEEVTVKRDW